MYLEGGVLLPVSAQTYVGPPSLSSSVSPTGKYVAFLTATDNRLHNLTLRVVSLPEIKLVHTIALTSPETEPGAAAAP